MQNSPAKMIYCLKQELGDLTEKQQQLVMMLELARVEEFLCTTYGLPGRPPADGTAIARAFVVKMIFTMLTTKVLIDWLKSDQPLHRLCCWERKKDIPREWTFSRAFAEFAENRLPEPVHEALIDIHARRNKALKEELANESKRRKAVNEQTAEDQRYNERSTGERVNGRLKDELSSAGAWCGYAVMPK